MFAESEDHGVADFHQSLDAFEAFFGLFGHGGGEELDPWVVVAGDGGVEEAVLVFVASGFEPGCDVEDRPSQFAGFHRLEECDQAAQSAVAVAVGVQGRFLELIPLHSRKLE